MNAFLTLSQTTNFRLFQIERVCRRQIQISQKMAESSPKGLKTLWEKEKLLVTSNFSFSHSVFKIVVLQTRKNQGLLGKGLNGKLDIDKTIEFSLKIWKTLLVKEKMLVTSICSFSHSVFKGFFAIVVNFRNCLAKV